MLNVIVFGVMPYLSVVLLLIVTIGRYVQEPAAFTSSSTQFLEGKKLFWGSVPLHLALTVLFIGHLIGLLIPSAVTAWNGSPVRLLVLEASGMTAGMVGLVGLVALAYRRLTDERLRAVSRVSDYLAYAALLFAIVTGLWVAATLRWGSSWYTTVVVPYLWSVAKLQPDFDLVTPLPLAARLHIGSGFLLLAIFGTTSLVHALFFPIAYLWRPLQLVIWNRARGGSSR